MKRREQTSRPAAIRSLSSATAAVRARIEGLFLQMVALGDHLQEKERAYEAELGEGDG